MVDAASVEGRDPIADIKAINQELASYNPELAKRPQVIAANKIDAMSEEDCQTIVEMLEEEFGPQGIKVFPISAVSGKGLKELLWHVNTLLKELPEEPVEFEQEYFFEMQQEEPADDSPENAAFFLLFRRLNGYIGLGRIAVWLAWPAGRFVLHNCYLTVCLALGNRRRNWRLPALQRPSAAGSYS